MKYQRTMPKDEEKKYDLMPEGEHTFQITDIYKEDEEEITVKCEVISTNGTGLTLLYRISNNHDSKFFWLTKLFLKCIGEPHEGDVIIDTDSFIGRQFCGEVKQKDGYANIKKLIYKDIEQYRPPVNNNPDGVNKPEEIQW